MCHSCNEIRIIYATEVYKGMNGNEMPLLVNNKDIIRNIYPSFDVTL